jgi:hypothetical protein
LEKWEKEAAEELAGYDGEGFPVTRDKCRGGHRPCPYVRCRYNLYLDVKKVANGSAIRVNFPELEGPHQLKDSCALDVADANPDGMTLEEMGNLLNITRERARQLEGAVIRKLRKKARMLRDPKLNALLEQWEHEYPEGEELGFYILG